MPQSVYTECNSMKMKFVNDASPVNQRHVCDPECCINEMVKMSNTQRNDFLEGIDSFPGYDIISTGGVALLSLSSQAQQIRRGLFCEPTQCGNNWRACFALWTMDKRMAGDGVKPQVAGEVQAIAFRYNMCAIFYEIHCTARMLLQVANLEDAEVIRGPLPEASICDPLSLASDDVPRAGARSGPVMRSFRARVALQKCHNGVYTKNTTCR